MTTNPTHFPELTAQLQRLSATARLAERLDSAKDPALLEKQRLARENFDLEATWAALPPATAPKPQSTDGAAGKRLQGPLRTSWPEPLLEEFARDVLGARRINSGYLEALRIVLGNQAQAEREGYTLEQNRRVDFTTERTMRTINAQMHAAGITEARSVGLGSGRAQAVYCFVPEPWQRRTSLNAMMRREEEQGERLGYAPPVARVPSNILESDIPC
jgi:hypothetical protein